MQNSVLITTDALNMLLATSGAFFTMALKSRRAGIPEAPSLEELRAMQLAIIEAVGVLGQQASPTLQWIMRERV